MPELPEVETIRRDLSVLAGRKIEDVEILAAKTARQDAAFFRSILKGDKLMRIDRRGKLLIFVMKSGWNLLIHLKMTGQLIYRDKKRAIKGGHSFTPSDTAILPGKHTRAIFSFEKGGTLYFNDLRRFGYLSLAEGKELDKILEKGYGPEPLTAAFSAETLYSVLHRKSTNLKAALLDQRLVAGLGNIYVDETLFEARLRPTRIAKSLTRREVQALVASANRVIKKAIEFRGTTFSDYRDAGGKKGNFSRFLKVYGKKGEACPVCGTEISRIRLAGRGTHFCSHCQK